LTGIELDKFGEGFWVTTMFVAFAALVLCVAMVTQNEVAKTATTSVVTVLGMIAAFWFPTRGQTSGDDS